MLPLAVSATEPAVPVPVLLALRLLDIDRLPEAADPAVKEMFPPLPLVLMGPAIMDDAFTVRLCPALTLTIPPLPVAPFPLLALMMKLLAPTVKSPVAPVVVTFIVPPLPVPTPLAFKVRAADCVTVLP